MDLDFLFPIPPKYQQVIILHKNIPSKILILVSVTMSLFGVYTKTVSQWTNGVLNFKGPWSNIFIVACIQIRAQTGTSGHEECKWAQRVRVAIP